MKWIKKGLIYCPDSKMPWVKHSALQPTPFLLTSKIIRIFVGFRDKNGVSRVGFVDVNSKNPSEVLGVSDNTVLDIGIPGSFDENGVVPSAVIKRNNKLYLYYAGYQLGQRVRFYVYGGLAISKDQGNSFVRYKKVPILDRSENELFFRVIHSIMFEDGIWKVWYGGGSKFIRRLDKTYPVYDIRYIESKDGVNFKDNGKICIKIKDDGEEHRVARPYVIKDNNIYKMFYGIGTISKGYRLGYAESIDGINWERKDKEIGISVSEKGWDSKMICYPSVVKYKDKVYIFYNGNNYGYDGFGYAVLEKW